MSVMFPKWIVAQVLLVCVIVGCAELPSDEQLVDRLSQNRDAFERLARQTQPLLSDQWFSARRGENADLDELMGDLGINKIYGYKTLVYFSCTGVRHLVRGEKGFAFVPLGESSPDQNLIVESLDDAARDGSPQRRLRALGGGWYLYYQPES